MGAAAGAAFQGQTRNSGDWISGGSEIAVGSTCGRAMGTWSSSRSIVVPLLLLLLLGGTAGQCAVECSGAGSNKACGNSSCGIWDGAAGQGWATKCSLQPTLEVQESQNSSRLGLPAA